MAYYAIFYHKDGTFAGWQAETEAECRAKLIDMLKCRKVYDRCAGTTIVQRTPSTGGLLFGKNPKTDVLTEFNKALKAGEIAFDEDAVWPKQDKRKAKPSKADNRRN